MLDGSMQLRQLTAEHDAAVAELIRTNLKAHQLDIPGTVYFDEGLDHLSAFYDDPGRVYYVLLQDGQVVGGIGLAKFDFFESCCELQKLYLSDAVKGRGLGYDLIDYAGYGYFLRAESFYNVATKEEEYSRGPGGRSQLFHEKSHGESFLALAQNSLSCKRLISFG